MGTLKIGEPFGLEAKRIDEIDWDLAISRIVSDIKSDFIFAPHISVIFRLNRSAIIDGLKADLKAGKFLPGQPITIEVPKQSRMKVASNPPRHGPVFSRPGSILMPKDRLMYQVLADQAANLIDAKTDHNRSFSHKINKEEPEKMFQQTRVCWNGFQEALRKHSKSKKFKYVLKLDVANFFWSINQHKLINTLDDAGFQKPYVDRLENLLTSFSSDKSSRGIVQGLFPSDLFGNFYLEPFDRFLDDLGVPSCRYVDDIFIFVESVKQAEAILRKAIPELRQYDLSISEAKSKIIPKASLVVEEPDLELLFEEAIDEIAEQLSEGEFDTDYGFQSEWEEEDEVGSFVEAAGEEEIKVVDLELAATERLFESIGNFVGHEENIERFCLPLFSKSKSDFAVDHVISSFLDRPSMSQIYCSYLSGFIHEERVFNFLSSTLKNDELYDWQLMWVIAALLQSKKIDNSVVSSVLKIFRDSGRHEAVRAIAAIYVGRRGDHARRSTLRSEYNKVTEYVQAAIYYSSFGWKRAEKATAKAAWANQGKLNSMIRNAMEPLKPAGKV